MNSYYCGAYCGPAEELSANDKKALLKEQEAILEAKLATVRHLMETADDVDSGKGKK